MEGRITPENIENLEDYHTFVFGSNLWGKNGAGAALLAAKKGWAVSGKGYGHHWKDNDRFIGSYAIPTKGLYIETLPIEWIKYYVDHFIVFAKTGRSQTFLVTEIGCGLAGYIPEQIAPLFKEAVKYDNIHLPQRFWDVLNKK